MGPADCKLRPPASSVVSSAAQSIVVLATIERRFSTTVDHLQGGWQHANGEHDAPPGNDPSSHSDDLGGAPRIGPPDSVGQQNAKAHKDLQKPAMSYARLQCMQETIAWLADASAPA